jgi:hypothetical protein
MELLRFSYINDDYHPDVVQRWSDGGCREEMERRLGYRLSVVSLNQPESVAPGDPFVLELDIENVGWATPMNPRPVFLLLESGSQLFRLEAQALEVRSWLPSRTSTVQFRGVLPATLDPGTVTLLLQLPDTDSGLQGDPRYSIRLANDQMWQAESGANLLGTLTVDASAPTDQVTGAAPFEQVE